MNSKNENIFVRFGKKFLFFQEAFVFGKSKSDACSPAIEGKIENKEKNYLIVLLFNWV